MSLVPIALIGDKLGIPEHLIEPCGRYSAKVRLELLDEVPVTRGKLILVTAITQYGRDCRDGVLMSIPASLGRQ